MQKRLLFFCFHQAASGRLRQFISKAMFHFSLLVDRDSFGTHYGNAEAGEALGLELVYTFVSSKADRDRYEGLQWYATAEYARSHPDDPDLPEILERVSKAKVVYLRWGR